MNALNAPALVRTGLGDQIRQVLIDGITSGRLQPGERIVERRIASELGVSQAPVREALRQLEALRLVETTPNRGARVRDFTEADFREFFPVRAGLEETAADLAAPRLAGRVESLEVHIERLTAASGADVMRHSIAFHREIVEAAGNRLLRSVWESLGIEIWTTLSVRRHDTELCGKTAEHIEIAGAFRRRDPSVGRLLHDHVMSYAP
ncbi:GntR family transcriptional regulator [Actinoallomurus bryophytorum]|uniref:GntR family transcriptional regulator n=1 Tax=Actinoallomurus bryophytorum TaxID=1490222 RepID=A0A543CW14_9ACTN|nr:GntR family transcriptional regulator [Actinoallomurus bryophytorum]TQM01297.1 GntR family transcriptional regulator [Actinoallomurus bryophytorum]